jgi:hypothetical protein
VSKSNGQRAGKWVASSTSEVMRFFKLRLLPLLYWHYLLRYCLCHLMRGPARALSFVLVQRGAPNRSVV